MKKILLLSDTHSYIDDDILKYVKQADEVWHAGDIGDLSVTDSIKKIKPLRPVFGNPLDNKARVATAKAKTAQLKKDNPSMVKRAAGAVGSAIRGS